MIVLIPCKSLSAGKTRLSPCLDAAERQQLCTYFLTRTIELAIALTGAERVRLVTSDPAAASIAARHAVLTCADSDAGLNAALTKARAEIAAQGLSRLMVLPIDLPYATADALATAARTEADIAINSDERGRGTNLLLLSRKVSQFQFRFGEDSFGAHASQARAAGYSLHLLEDARLARDIDEPDQYLAWRKSAGFPHALMTPEGVESLTRQGAAT